MQNNSPPDTTRSPSGVRSDAEVAQLVATFLDRIAAIDSLVGLFSQAGDASADVPGRVDLEDDIDAIGTNDKPLARAIRRGIKRRFSPASPFVTECARLLTIFINADEEEALLANEVDWSREAVASWAEVHGWHVGRRGRLRKIFLDHYRDAMREEVQDRRHETLREFSAHDAVVGGSIDRTGGNRTQPAQSN